MGFWSDLSHDFQQSVSSGLGGIADVVSAGFGGIGDFLLDIGGGTAGFMQDETRAAWTEPFEDLTTSVPFWGAVAIVGWALFKK